MILDMHIWQSMVINQKKMIKILILLLLAIDLFIIAIGAFFGGNNFIISSQVAFFCSIFIVLGTFFGYYKNVKSRVEHTLIDERDDIDKIEDPYDLYDDFEINEQQDFTSEEIKSIIKEEKQNLKNNNLKNTISSLSSFASIYRIAGYVLLVIGFFFLKNNEILDIYGLLAGVSVVPIFGITLGFFKDKI